MRSSQLILLPLLLSVACAQVRDPVGGEKDGRGPRLLGAVPDTFSTHFSGRRILLQFDERVKLDRVRERLLISPPLRTTPEVHLAGSSAVVIDLKEDLEPNTTYTFNLGDAVVDLTENNPATGLNYVISTGDHLDSVRTQGSVVNARNGNMEEGVLVLLYTMSDTDSTAVRTFRSDRPTYFARSDAKGRFEIGHIRPGSYWCYGLKDQNANYRYDLPNEDIAFVSVPLLIDGTTPEGPTLQLFREQSATQRIIASHTTANGALELVMARRAGGVRLLPLDWNGGELSWWLEANDPRDTLLFWPNDTTALTGRRFVVLDDSSRIDTVSYVLTGTMPYYVDLQLSQRNTPQGVLVDLHASRPIAAMDSTRAMLEASGAQTPVSLQLDSTDRRTVHVVSPSLEGASTKLTLLPKVVRDDLGGYNDTLHFSLGGAIAAEIGALQVRIGTSPGKVSNDHPAGPFILQLVNAQGGVLREERFTEWPHTVDWKALSPGAYGLRLLEDNASENGRWDTGSLSRRQQPEFVTRFTGDVIIRARWDVQVQWEF